jgi:hypothetical protein
MFKQLTRGTVTAVVPMLLLTASSALAAHDVRPARAHARHSAGPRQRTGGRAHRKRVAAVRHSTSPRADLQSTALLLGDRTVESQYDSLVAGQAEAFRFRAVTSGLAGAVHVYVGSANAASTVVVGLYGDANGHPSSLLSTGSVTLPHGGGWNPVSIAPVRLVSGAAYWLALLGRGGTLRYRDRGHGWCPSETSAQVSLGALPTAWKASAPHPDCPVSAYVTAEDPPSPLELPGPFDPTAPVAPSAPLEPSPPAAPPPSEEPAPPLASPVNTALPTIVGSAVRGQVISAGRGSWSGSPTSYAYQWQDCNASGAGCANVSGETSSNYTLASRDVAHRVRVLVSASNAGGSATADSAPTAAVVSPPPPAPVNTASPSVTGLALEGEALSASRGTWSGSPTSYAYQWQDCDPLGLGCANVSGATSSSYELAASDVGNTVRVVVTASNAGGSSSASSAATSPVVASSSQPSAPADLTAPSVSGTAQVGHTLAASSGTWSGSPTSYAYQWQDCSASGEGCSNVSGATSASYGVAEADLGHAMRVVVSASNAGGVGMASSAATGVVVAAPPPPPPVNIAPPALSGSAVEGATLTASNGTWSGSPTSYSYQWQDCNSAGASCSNIGGATASTRVLSSSDVAHTVRVVLTASNAGGSTTVPSGATAEVASSSGGGAPEPACTVETESTATAKADLAINGEVVCLKESGSPYSSIAISSGPSTINSTLVSAPGKHVVVRGVTITTNHITVEGLHIEGGINVGAGNSTAYNHDVIAWNDISNASGDGVGVFARVEGPVSEFINIEHNKIHNTSLTSEGDAIHAQGWANLTVRENDIYEISEEACKGACHDDIFQTYNAGFKTAHDFAFEGNYVHDNDTEGILLKDGDTTPNATIRDNLMVRDERWGGIAGVWVDDCTHNLVIEKNTLTEGNNVQPLSGSCVEPSAIVKQNVLGRMKLGGEAASGTYALTSERNIFGEGAAGLYKTGAGDEARALSGAATFRCSPGCKAGNDDYRLLTNPKEAGIDWNPNEQSWGPNH